MMIEVVSNPTADTRTCDWSAVSRETLLDSSLNHISDVAKGLGFFIGSMVEAAARHDHDKVSDIDGFHRDFATGFAQTAWWDKHRKVNRHHLNIEDGIPDDVNLVDVIEYIVDCVMAAIARSGNVLLLEIPPEILQQAFQNTVELLKRNVKVMPEVDV